MSAGFEAGIFHGSAIAFDLDGTLVDTAPDLVRALNEVVCPLGLTAVPVNDTVGEGIAWVFSQGKVVQGTWARASETEWFTLTDEDGNELPVPPGRLWLVLAQKGGVVYE